LFWNSRIIAEEASNHNEIEEFETSHCLQDEVSELKIPNTIRKDPHLSIQFLHFSNHVVRQACKVNEMRDDQFDRPVNFLFSLGTDVRSWYSALDFLGPTLRLCQPQPGPCGLIAVLQAYILLNHNRSPGLSDQEYLIPRSILSFAFAGLPSLFSANSLI
jgi:hypothetical protein